MTENDTNSVDVETAYQAGFAAGRQQIADDNAGLLAFTERVREVCVGVIEGGDNPGAVSLAHELRDLARRVLMLHGGDRG
jgi:hypothetical protein